MLLHREYHFLSIPLGRGHWDQLDHPGLCWMWEILCKTLQLGHFLWKTILNKRVSGNWGGGGTESPSHAYPGISGLHQQVIGQKCCILDPEPEAVFP